MQMKIKMLMCYYQNAILCTKLLWHELKPNVTYTVSIFFLENMTIPNKFPDIAECYYNVTGVAGGSNVSNGLCFCSMNTVIEKTVLISWVWIVVITSMNVLKILVQVTLFLIPPLRAQFLLFKVYFCICCHKSVWKFEQSEQKIGYRALLI